QLVVISAVAIPSVAMRMAQSVTRRDGAAMEAPEPKTTNTLALPVDHFPLPCDGEWRSNVARKSAAFGLRPLQLSTSYRVGTSALIAPWALAVGCITFVAF